MHIVNAATMQALDQRTIQQLGLPDLVLMERAALGIFNALQRHFGHQLQQLSVLAGSGNNGGDGLALARLLHCQNVPVQVWLASPQSGSAAYQQQLQMVKQLQIPCQVAAPAALAAVQHSLAQSSLIVDALFGVGLSRPVTGLYAELIALANAAATPILAVDLPSGLQADTGQTLGCAIQAAVTVSCALPKWAHYMDPALDAVGQLEVVDIGIPPDYYADHPEQVLCPAVLRSLLPPVRKRNSHKGTYGQLGIVAGSLGMSGAAQLAAQAALQSGVGLVFLYVPASIQSILAGALPEVQVRPLPEQDGQLSSKSLQPLLNAIGEHDALLIGPGLGRQSETGLFLQGLLEAALPQPLVLDADALWHLAQRPQATAFTQPVILTPHPGEMAQLLGCSTAAVQADRVTAARQAALQYQAVSLLKGARSLIATPDGQLAFNASGNPGMARGGMGDLLAGLCGGLLAQGQPAYNAARLAAAWHGLAGDLAAAEQSEACLSLRALLAQLPSAWRQLAAS
ncbi:MAG: NAD(P)H-hydrate dehydratase [Candidatus Sericytochromatia bacterium]|nr:NAD(P)H-hydrate dehydratase [Candidatus Sericytochromatia bacterium]